jgi:hypothetical protein
VLKDVRQVGAAPEPLEKAAALADAAAVFDHARQPGHQAIVKAWHFIRGGIFVGPEVHPGFQDGKVRPDIRSAQSLHLANFHAALPCRQSRTSVRQRYLRLSRSGFLSHDRVECEP